MWYKSTAECGLDSARHHDNGLMESYRHTKTGTISDRTTANGETSLIADLVCGDDAAVEKFVLTHTPWMTSVAERLLVVQSLAEDCVQEVFFNVLRKIGDFEERSSLKTWLHHIVVNQALMKLRVMRKRNEAPIDDYLPVLNANSSRIEGSWQRLETPDEILEREDRRLFILSQIKELPEDCRLIIQLRDIDELTTQETAKELRLSEVNVRVRLHRARSALKKLLEPVLTGEL